MFKKILSFSSLMFACNCLAGELVREAIVAEVASNGTANAVNFGVRVEGGTGLCTNWIFFPQTKSASLHLSEATYNHAFSLATTALATGQKVRIHNYTGNECNGADLISVSK